MKCKNCGIENPKQAKRCNKCGAELKKNSIVMIIIAVVVVVVCLALVIVAILLMSEKDSGQTLSIGDPSAYATADPSNDLTTSNIDSDGNVAITKRDEVVPTSNVNNISLDEAKSVTANVSSAANDYFNSYNQTSEFSNRNGFLYDVPGHRYVTLSDIDPDGKFDPSYNDMGILILFMRPSDLANYSEMSIPNISSDLKIYAAVETSDGYIINSTDSGSGVITNDEMNELLSLYNSDHGDIARYSSTDANYDEIIKAIESYTSDSSGFYIHYAAGDKKYACAIVSPVGDVNDFKEYILENDNGTWSVVLDGIENVQQVNYFINGKVVDFDIDILPENSIYNQIVYLRPDFDDVISIMTDKGILTADMGAPTYVCGNNNFVYMEFGDGTKYIGELADGTWTLHPVSNYLDAESYITANSKNEAPTYIVHQS